MLSESSDNDSEELPQEIKHVIAIKNTVFFNMLITCLLDNIRGVYVVVPICVNTIGMQISIDY